MNICPQALTWNILMLPSGEVECISTPTDFELGYVILLSSSVWEEVVVYQFWAEAFNNITYVSLILLNSCTQPEYQRELCIKQTWTHCRCWRQARLNLAEKSRRHSPAIESGSVFLSHWDFEVIYWRKKGCWIEQSVTQPVTELVSRRTWVWPLAGWLQSPVGKYNVHLCLASVKMCFPGASGSKESACNAEDPVSIPGLRRFPRGMATHSNILAWGSHGQRSLACYSKHKI